MTLRCLFDTCFDFSNKTAKRMLHGPKWHIYFLSIIVIRSKIFLKKRKLFVKHNQFKSNHVLFAIRFISQLMSMFALLTKLSRFIDMCTCLVQWVFFAWSTAWLTEMTKTSFILIFIRNSIVFAIRCRTIGSDPF